MILDRSQALVNRVTELQSLKKQSRELWDFHNVDQALQRSVNRLTALLPTAELFARRGIGKANVANLATAALVQVQAAVSLAKAEPDHLTDRSRFNATELDGKVEEVTQPLDAQLQEMWVKYANKQIPPLDTDVLTTLANLPPLREWANRVRAALVQVETLRTRRPKTDPELDAFLSAVTRLQHTNDEFGGDLPKELLEFIRAAAGSGLALPHYTPELATELKRRNWERYFVITVSASGR